MDDNRLTSMSPSLTNGVTPSGVAPNFANQNKMTSEPNQQSWVGTAISAAIAAGVAIYNGVRTKKENARQRKWQEEQVDKANAYNDPSAQKERLQNAGINLLGADMSNSPSQQVGNPTQFDPRIDGSAVSSLLGLGIQSMMTQAQVENIKADTEGKEIDNQSKGDRNAKELDFLSKQIENLTADTGLKRESASKLVQDVQNSIRELDLKEGELNNSIELMHLEQQKFNFDKLMRNKEYDLNVKYAALAEAKVLNEQYLSLYQADLSVAQTKQINRSTEMIDYEIEQIRKNVDWFDVNQIFTNAGKAFSAARDLAIGIGAVASGIKGFSIGTQLKPDLYKPSAKETQMYGNIPIFGSNR